MSGESAPAAPASLISETPAQAAVAAPPAAPLATPAPAVAPAFKFPDNFDYKTIVPEDIRGDAVFSKYQNLESALRGLHGAQKLLGKDPSNLVEVPPATDAAATRALMNRLGASEKAEDYKFEPVKGAPDWLGTDKPLSQWLAKTAHSEGIPVSTMNKLYAGFVGEMTKAVQAQQADAVALAEKSIEGLRTKLGEDFDGTVRRAKLAIEKLGGAPLRAALEAADLGVNEHVIMALAKVGELYAESDDGADKGLKGDALPSEIKSEAQALIEKSHAANDPAERKRLQAEAAKLFARARGGKKV